MTLEEKIESSLKASRARRTLGLIVGLWFIIEYLHLVASTHNMYLMLLRYPMMVVTPVLIFYLTLKQRKQFFPQDFSRAQGFFYTTELMFYGGLIDAFFCLAYNQWIMPGNLAEMRDGLIVLFEQMKQMMEGTTYAGLTSIYNQAIEALKEAPVETPINAAINLLSTDLFYGIFLGIINGIILRRRPKN